MLANSDPYRPAAFSNEMRHIYDLVASSTSGSSSGPSPQSSLSSGGLSSQSIHVGTETTNSHLEVFLSGHLPTKPFPTPQPAVPPRPFPVAIALKQYLDRSAIAEDKRIAAAMLASAPPVELFEVVNSPCSRKPVLGISGLLPEPAAGGLPELEKIPELVPVNLLKKATESKRNQTAVKELYEPTEALAEFKLTTNPFDRRPILGLSGIAFGQRRRLIEQHLKLRPADQAPQNLASSKKQLPVYANLPCFGSPETPIEKAKLANASTAAALFPKEICLVHSSSIPPAGKFTTQIQPSPSRSLLGSARKWLARCNPFKGSGDKSYKPSQHEVAPSSSSSSSSSDSSLYGFVINEPAIIPDRDYFGQEARAALKQLRQQMPQHIIFGSLDSLAGPYLVIGDSNDATRFDMNSCPFGGPKTLLSPPLKTNTANRKLHLSQPTLFGSFKADTEALTWFAVLRATGYLAKNVPVALHYIYGNANLVWKAVPQLLVPIESIRGPEKPITITDKLDGAGESVDRLLKNLAKSFDEMVTLIALPRGADDAQKKKASLAMFNLLGNKVGFALTERNNAHYLIYLIPLYGPKEKVYCLSVQDLLVKYKGLCKCLLVIAEKPRKIPRQVVNAGGGPEKNRDWAVMQV